MRACRCECVDNRESGACVTGGSSLDLLDNRLANNQHDGLAVGGIGSTCRALRSQFSGNMTKGVGVYMGGVVEMQECSAFNNVAKCMQVRRGGRAGRGGGGAAGRGVEHLGLEMQRAIGGAIAYTNVKWQLAGWCPPWPRQQRPVLPLHAHSLP